MSTASEPGRLRSFSQVLLGRPLETAEAPHQAIGKLPALAVFASDALSSVAYATEEILVILALAGAAFLGLSLPIALAISLLLLVVTFSYRQTIYAYPGGGGAYIVASENLGAFAGQIAGAALMTDYILTVAVSISCGVAQIVSAFPGLTGFRVALALLLILIIAILNLRGTRESSAILSVPTYAFILMAALMIGSGLVRWAKGDLGQVVGVVPPASILQPMSLFLILRAFSSGSTALTGIEAIANGISAFREPRPRNAATTLTAMSAILLALFLGVTFLARQVGAIPSHDETVISQIARTVFGSGLLYLLTLACTTVILVMAANTSFADFPRLGALLAADGYLPRQFTLRGSRLVFSWGITGLAAIASFLVLLFRASVTALIPLYAIGVFLCFTLSQAGMVVHWLRLARAAGPNQEPSQEARSNAQRAWGWKLALNLFGALATSVVTIIFAVTKFRNGAWVIVFLIPALSWGFRRIRRHYREVAQELSLAATTSSQSLRPLETLVLIDRLHAAALRTIRFATSLGVPWIAIHVSIDERQTEELRKKWKAHFGDLPLVILPSPYRSLTQPVLDYIARLRQSASDAFIHVVFGELVTESFWEQTLHENSAFVLELALRQLDGVVVTRVPFHLYHVRDHDQGTEG